ncbi:hypothetical protein PRZ48_008229 [Zasmidium cellare]|uniref:Fe2OG dioxygenase domain-containing protein n=1 Tax=Zasmidium cellare TaxID=395010 RepID=A0ABR0EFR2_ZASCE|nr:hypothetical protein PRZ48_008229 [Zasmidium cellare]
MASEELNLPIIDLSPYLHPQNDTDKAKVVSQVRDACAKYGFFQVSGHGIPLHLQNGLLQAIGKFFHQDKEAKMKLSFLENRGRRGYEASGMSVRDGDKLPDSKESFYIGREEPEFEAPGFHCPNQWPETLPREEFRDPVWEYYQETDKLGRTIWEILLLGLGRDPTAVMEQFTKRPIVQMKMIRYPPGSATLPEQFGVGAHTDFGGVTVLLQQANRSGLQVYLDSLQTWISVPALEDIYVINCGDMIAQWSGGIYRSARHRVINASVDEERLSCATFWHGDADATNPLDEGGVRDTVGKLLMQRFKGQFSIPREVVEAAGRLGKVGA